MLLQRLGRLWRHDRPGRRCSRPEVWIQVPECDDAFLSNANSGDLLNAIGKSARVYAPYVLLRSLKQWQRRATITLPDDIREILEATYTDPAPSEPPGWHELWEELERRKKEMAGRARSATTVWHNPALEDEEGIQTRYSTYRTAKLLLARQITPLRGAAVRLDLLNGDRATASSRDWDFNAAKAIHRNLTRMPLWAIAAGLNDPPRWLTNHVSQLTALGILSYDADQGIIISRESTRRRAHEEFDESYN